MEPVGIYIHIPFCIRKCNYCDFPSYPGYEGIFHDYAEAVGREMANLAREYGSLSADTVFIGGGTPSLLSAQDISIIIDTLQKTFCIQPDAEITLEANPGTISREKAEAWKSLGINRISIGLQAAQDCLLQSMGRVHTRNMFLESIGLIGDIGIKNINTDIIFGVPGQNIEDWMETLELVLKTGVSHISAYSLQIEEGTPWFELQKKGKLPNVDEDLERAMHDRTIERLADNGFVHYEISNFAKPGFECRHNLKYWTGKPYLGIGAAAHSYIDDIRSANISNPPEYIRKIKNHESPQSIRDSIGFAEKLSERFFLGLRLIRGISLTSLENEFGRQAIQKYRDIIKQLEGRKLITLDGDMLKLTRLGLDYANQVWMEFL